VFALALYTTCKPSPLVIVYKNKKSIKTSFVKKIIVIYMMFNHASYDVKLEDVYHVALVFPLFRATREFHGSWTL
jgi:hypothetical protein